MIILTLVSCQVHLFILMTSAAALVYNHKVVVMDIKCIMHNNIMHVCTKFAVQSYTKHVTENVISLFIATAINQIIDRLHVCIQ